MEYGPDKSLPDPLQKTGDVVLDAHGHFAANVNSFDAPIINKDLTGMIISWNRAAAHVFGYQAEEIIGQSILRLLPPNFHHEENELAKAQSRRNNRSL